jgi:hypothetical protein
VSTASGSDLLVGVFASGSAQAIGFGVYFEYGHAWGNQDREIDPFGSATINQNFEADQFGGGFALDTAVAKDTLFNYRLNVGYQFTDRMYEGSFSGLPRKVESHGFSLNNIFGFGVYRSELMRVWLGPSIRFSTNFHSDFDGFLGDVDVATIGVGGGLATGINFHTGTIGSASLSLGYQYLYSGEIRSVEVLDDSRINSGGEHVLAVNVSYFFRSRGDRFRPAWLKK